MAEEYKKQEERMEETRTPEQMSERIEAGRATRTGEADKPDLPDVPGGTDAPESNADKTFQANMERQKYAHTNDLIGRLEKEQEELADNRTPEQKKKAERREKMAKIFAALGDGVAAMSNLVLTSKGAIPYQSRSMISKAVGDRYAQFRKDLEDRKAKSLALSERIAQLRQGVEDRKAEDERFEYQRKRQEEQGKMNKELHGLKMQGLELENQYKQAQINDIAARRDYQNKALEVKKAIAELNAMSRKEVARLRGAGGRSGGSGKTWKLLDKTYRNLDEYKAAVEEAAIQLGISNYNTVEYQSGYKTNERVMPKSIAQKAAEITQKSKESNGTQGGKWGFSIHKK